ncbi:hypothetical protein PTTG_03471 [Puccinia triticina 1-1 BBBD Race 1]|uniref:Uncharacterized protein n=1 Tax=Puccinia triticina (isolate 1-1 / race 1 (BBBD)) TaxID=630390 RepID=A0A0C4ERQ1_PUCT1|nr:hypothetical protein PTTG_03471 [Puccinia triticina 1-1 BBBD Race 1]
MSNFCQVQNVSSILSLIATLDGTKAVLPQWCNRLEGVLGMQNTRPGHTCHTIWLTLSDPLSQRYHKVKPASCLFSTIVNAYEKNTRACCMCLHKAFWTACHDPNEPIALWISHVRVAADDLLTVKEPLTNCQIADRLVGGLDSSWSNVWDAIVYTATEMSLDDVLGAMEAHEVSLNGNKATNLASASFAYNKPGAATAVKLGDYESGSYDDNNKVNVIYK